MKTFFKIRMLFLQTAVVFILCTLLFGFGPGPVVDGGPSQAEVERRVMLEHRITALEEQMTNLAWMQRAALAGLGGLLLEMLARLKKGESG